MFQSKSPELLKIVAIILMVLDHVGLILDDNMVLRTLGRFALPLFIFQLVNGYLTSKNHLSNLKLLLLFAVISYLPYNVMIYSSYWEEFVTNQQVRGTWNVFMPLSIAYFCMMLAENKNVVGQYLMVMISPFIDMDYGWFIPVMTLTIYHISQQPTLNDVTKMVYVFLSYSILNTLYAIDVNSIWIQLLAPLGIPLAICLLKVDIGFRLPKLLYFWVYPLHILILSIVKVMK